MLHPDSEPTLPVFLEEVAGEMLIQSEESSLLISKRTGHIVFVSDEHRQRVEGGYTPESLPDWQAKELANIEEAMNSDEYIPLPTQYDIHEWQIMKDFCLSRSNDDHKRLLLNGIRSNGAFQFFKRSIRDLDIEQEWYDFRDDEVKEQARQFLDAHDIPYTEKEET